MRNINADGLTMIKDFEGFSAKPYLDIKGIPTIGIGTTYYPISGKKVTMKDSSITMQQALEYVNLELDEKESIIDHFLQKLKISLNDNQFSALCSFAYNCGAGPVIEGGRTLGEALRSKDINKIADAFLVYDKINKKVLGINIKTQSAGLARRRIAERALFLKG